MMLMLTKGALGKNNAFCFVMGCLFLTCTERMAIVSPYISSLLLKEGRGFLTSPKRAHLLPRKFAELKPNLSPAQRAEIRRYVFSGNEARSFLSVPPGDHVFA